MSYITQNSDFATKLAGNRVDNKEFLNCFKAVKYALGVDTKELLKRMGVTKTMLYNTSRGNRKVRKMEFNALVSAAPPFMTDFVKTQLDEVFHEEK